MQPLPWREGGGIQSHLFSLEGEGVGRVDIIIQEAQPELPGSLGNNFYCTTVIRFAADRVRLESIAI